MESELLHALEGARRFIEGFQGDELQTGIQQMLADLDREIAKLKDVQASQPDPSAAPLKRWVVEMNATGMLTATAQLAVDAATKEEAEAKAQEAAKELRSTDWDWSDVYFDEATIEVGEAPVDVSSIPETGAP